MASQSSFEEIATPAENPSTPQPLDTELPSKDDMPRSNSPTTSMMVAGSSSVLHSSSITPPPSSQVAHLRRPTSVSRSITPEPMALSSPPPTNANGNKRDVASKVLSARPTPDQIDDATTEELREMILRVVADNTKLDMAVSEARMSAAHYKLQHNLLTIESEEALKRMEVEHDITRREVQVLQVNGRDTSTNDYTQKLKAYCESIKEEIALVRRRLEKAKRVIEMKDEELMDAKDEIYRLQTRIRQNREHINVLRSPGGPLHVSTPKATPATPHQYRGTPKYTPGTNRSVRYELSQNSHQERFNALLLAGSVLSQAQENNSAPSTPTAARRPDPRTPNRHNRGAQSLSSFPTTPGSGRQVAGNSGLLPSAQFSPHSEARVATTLSQHVAQHSRERSRKSRDSTISASDSEGLARDAYREESEEIQESQASQSATEMLRADPRESFEIAASRTSTPLPSDKNLQQSKIYGSITKRKLDIDHGTDPVKKMRSEGVGLGIGF